MIMFINNVFIKNLDRVLHSKRLCIYIAKKTEERSSNGISQYGTFAYEWLPGMPRCKFVAIEQLRQVHCK